MSFLTMALCLLFVDIVELKEDKRFKGTLSGLNQRQNTYTFGLNYFVDESACETSPIQIHKDRFTLNYFLRKRTRSPLLSHETKAYRRSPSCASRMLWQPGKGKS